MIPRILLSFLVVLIHVLAIAAWTNPVDTAALKSLRDYWQYVPSNWTGADPCGSSWQGVGCKNSRVISIELSSMSLNGELSEDIQGLSELETLDLSYKKDLTGELPRSIGKLTKLSNLILVGCAFSGPIPDSIGSMTRLVLLSLNSNKFTGGIPVTIGYLTELHWLDLSDNQIEGKIPVSSGSNPGLDMLVNTKRFHFGKNQLSGEIPARLFHSNMTLTHLLVENNRFTGEIPDTLGLVQTMQVLRLDRNSFSGSVPQNLNNLTNVNELDISNNNLNGLLPNLTSMNALNYLDMSSNTFNASDFPSWIPSLQSLTTLVMEDTGLQGSVPANLFSLHQLQTVILRNNKLNGSLEIGTTYSNQLQLIDVQNNLIESFTQRPGYPFQIMLAGNPFCNDGGEGTETYCIETQQTETYSTPQDNCLPTECSSNQVSSPTCKCAFPYIGNLVFRVISFSNLRNRTTYVTLQKALLLFFQKRQLPVESVSLRNPRNDLYDNLVIHLQLFPSGQDSFNATGVSGIGFVLSNQIFKPPSSFGPYVFIGEGYKYFDEEFTLLQGYLDPEYYLTNQLTEKSDVYSFGVVLLEIVTGKIPIDKGRYIVKEVKNAMDKTKDMYNLHEILDPAVRSGATPRSLEKFVDLALKCVEEEGVNRPKMSEVVKEIENIMEIAGLNRNADSESTSATYEGSSKGLNHSYTDESLFVYSEA